MVIRIKFLSPVFKDGHCPRYQQKRSWDGGILLSQPLWAVIRRMCVCSIFYLRMLCAVKQDDSMAHRAKIKLKLHCEEAQLGASLCCPFYFSWSVNLGSFLTCHGSSSLDHHCYCLSRSPEKHQCLVKLDWRWGPGIHVFTSGDDCWTDLGSFLPWMRWL